MYKIIANDSNIIPYRKELNAITGGVLESIFLSQFLYWYEKNGGEFYKFREPCSHSLYKQGDSWCEELEFSVKQIDRIIKSLKEKNIITTRTDINRITYYDVNLEQLNNLLNGIYVNDKREDIELPKGHLRSCQKGIYESAKTATSNKNNNNSTRDYYTETTITENTQIQKEKFKKENPQTFQKSQELESQTKSKTFQKPTIAEIDIYVQGIGATFKADEFFDFYESNGWRVGKNPMKDWKATCRRWKSNQKNFKPKHYQENNQAELNKCYANSTDHGDWWDKKIQEATNV
ncbi:hypothetical protein CFT13S00388_07965 [Campylobacter fetus subsp. testudinum]|uniref:hypothetical protein n=1 Tax=Campylobacter fetus TaxID=196 RepID=UPI000818BB59|nr:hypothetical protein [Campylobacter fetus]OCR86681.1 hypothetical protein CFT13S00388_07965 [Campylobacter fetus subsp. testudinum]